MSKDDLKKTIELEVKKRKEKVDRASTEVGGSLISVSRMYKTAGDITAEELSEEMIDITLPHPSAALAQVGYNARMTINLGDYESVQIGVT